MHELSRSQRLVASACIALLVASCGGDSPTAPGQTSPGHDDGPGVHAVLGANVTDTVDAQPLQALVVEVRGSDGKLVSGAVVRFEAQPPTDTTRRGEAAVSVCPLSATTCGPSGTDLGSGFQSTSDTTDAQGRAQAIVRLGSVAGRAVVHLTVPEFGMQDSATFTVLPGAPARVKPVTADTALTIGATANLRGHIVDRYGNNRPEPPVITLGPGNVLTFDAATGIVTGHDVGAQWMFMHFLQFAVDSTRVRVVPGGRLAVWSASEAVVRLVNLDGSASRTLVTGVAGDLGVSPRFNATRQGITLHDGTQSIDGPSNSVIVIDTTGSPRRDVGPAVGFAAIIATRQLADGTLLVVGSTISGAPCAGYALFRVEADNSLTCLSVLPGLIGTYAGADISHDGTRVAYVVPNSPVPISTGLELRVLDVATGATTVLAPDARAPRWSANDHRIAYLQPLFQEFYNNDGEAMVINADGTGRLPLMNSIFSPGISWSPDGKYLLGRSSLSLTPALLLVRISDGANVLLQFKTPAGGTADYYQPDWR